jgi:diaminohydroxyphosphoribosylaminopyrimidine deaminase/5-amino-6-(5-phosphoribosylamino)uracil reductase
VPRYHSPRFEAAEAAVNDETHMLRALALAGRGRGHVAPNPLVGSVVVRDGETLGEGFHARHGDRHGEVAALDSCTRDPANATLYCNLEPCATNYSADEMHPRGKLTGPCTDRIIGERISRVVIATLDPNPHVAGAGVRQLRAAGVRVDVGTCSEAALPLNVAYFTNELHRRPFVHLKIAQSLDGRIATETGESQWITDADARAQVHRMRSEHDAVLVGRGTAAADNPRLTDRRHPTETTGPQPWRVVLDSQLRLPASVHLLSDGLVARTIVLTSQTADRSRLTAIRATSASVIELAPSPQAGGGLDLRMALEELWNRGIRSILVEGGQQVYTTLLRERLYDQLTVFIAPTFIGTGVDALGDLGTDRIANAQQLEGFTMSRLNDQVVASGFRSLSAIRDAVVPASRDATELVANSTGKG